MDYAYMLGGGAPLIMKFACGDTHANAGVVTTAPDATQAGVMISTTTAMVDAVGVTQDTATYVTAQQTDGTSAERLISVLISPDACFRALMSGGATEGTAISEFTVTAATSDGLDVIDTAVDWTTPASDEGGIYFTSGVNQGQFRKVITTGGSEATIATAFDNDHAVGDTGFRVPWWPFDRTSDALQTTTNLYQADQNGAVGTGGDIKPIDLELNGVSDSFLIFTLDDHALNHSKAGIDG